MSELCVTAHPPRLLLRVRPPVCQSADLLPPPSLPALTLNRALLIYWTMLIEGRRRPWCHCAPCLICIRQTSCQPCVCRATAGRWHHCWRTDRMSGGEERDASGGKKRKGKEGSGREGAGGVAMSPRWAWIRLHPLTRPHSAPESLFFHPLRRLLRKSHVPVPLR